jgi:hypothetical protein
MEPIFPDIRDLSAAWLDRRRSLVLLEEDALFELVMRDIRNNKESIHNALLCACKHANNKGDLWVDLWSYTDIYDEDGRYLKRSHLCITPGGRGRHDETEADPEGPIEVPLGRLFRESYICKRVAIAMGGFGNFIVNQKTSSRVLTEGMTAVTHHLRLHYYPDLVPKSYLESLEKLEEDEKSRRSLHYEDDDVRILLF